MKPFYVEFEKGSVTPVFSQENQFIHEKLTAVWPQPVPCPETNTESEITI